MLVARADLAISCRFTLPMTAPEELLENHTVVVRDGRILDVLPNAAVAERYTVSVTVDRSRHLLMPGLVNACTQIVPGGRAAGSVRAADAAQRSIADMLRTGTTCCCSLGASPEEAARAAAEQGIRAVIGLPLYDADDTAARDAGGSLTRALSLRDEFRGHPSIGTVFAPVAPAAIGNATFERIATLADELDAGVLLALHETGAELADCVARHGMRPLERMRTLGLLTPALTALHMVQVEPADIALAERGGIAVVLCPTANVLAGSGATPAAAWAATSLRLGVGTGTAHWAAGRNLWSELRALGLLTCAGAPARPVARHAWDAIAFATRGAAAALGLDAELGTMEPGKWADLCCIALDHPALPGPVLRAEDALTAAAFGAAGDAVSDVWVAGRPLLNEGHFTRLDWPELRARLHGERVPPHNGG